MNKSSGALLCEALGVAEEYVVAVSRDPLAKGTVSGFDVAVPGTEVEGEAEAGAVPLRYYVDTSRLPVEQETGLALPPAEAPEARIWMHPADPHLPTLQAVAFHGAAEQLFERVGYESAGAPEFVAYRPGRRAVLRAQVVRPGANPATTLWVKVVRPKKVEGIVAAHNACAAAGLPVPQLEAWSPAGVMVLVNATGTPAASVDWDAERFIDEVDALRDRIATVEVGAGPADPPAQPKSVADRLGWYRQRLVESLPGIAASNLAAPSLTADRVYRIAEQAEALLAHDPSRPLRVVHGDLHFGQLFLSTEGPNAGEITGMIDVDTLGLGDAAEDPAAFIAHATVSALLSEDAVRPRVTRLAEAALERWGSDARVRGLVAVHLLGHALAAVDGGNQALADSLFRAAEAVLQD